MWWRRSGFGYARFINHVELDRYIRKSIERVSFSFFHLRIKQKKNFFYFFISWILISRGFSGGFEISDRRKPSHDVSFEMMRHKSPSIPNSLFLLPCETYLQFSMLFSILFNPNGMLSQTLLSSFTLFEQLILDVGFRFFFLNFYITNFKCRSLFSKSPFLSGVKKKRDCLVLEFSLLILLSYIKFIDSGIGLIKESWSSFLPVFVLT